MIVSIIGARPQFVKAAVVSDAFRKNNIPEIIIHTGQHYDEKMSKVFWQELGLPETVINLEAGSGTQGAQTAKMIEKLEAFLLTVLEKITAVLLYGDTNSTLAGSIVASKLNLPIIHVEAGLRSFNRTMPEEINRVVTDHLSNVLFCSSNEGVNQLNTEGVTKNVFNVGDVMYDAVKMFSETALQQVDINKILPFGNQPFSLITLHRPSNTDHPENLQSILKAIGNISQAFIWPLHPRLKNTIAATKIPSNVYIVSPLTYLEMLCTLNSCNKVLTDSGGLQKEAYWLKKPCVTLRSETEWVETLHDYWNIITAADTASIENAFAQTVSNNTWYPLYGDATAADQIAKTIRELFYSSN